MLAEQKAKLVIAYLERLSRDLSFVASRSILA
jgi:hypothetical protein